jgi:hypothetical protein
MFGSIGYMIGVHVLLLLLATRGRLSIDRSELSAVPPVIIAVAREAIK